MLHEIIKQLFMDADYSVASNSPLYAVNPSRDFSRSRRLGLD